MAKEPTKPLRIDLTIQDGRIISADGIIMLDSILYHAWFYKNAPHVLRGEGCENFSGYIGLPLKHLSGNRWAASKGIYTELSKSIEHYNKRPDFFAADKIGYLDMDKGLISDSVGIYRAYRNPVVVRTVKSGKISFWCCGHADEIKDLLSYIPGCGKKTSMGWGMISDCNIIECDNDYSLYHPDHGLMRPVPVDSPDVDIIPPVEHYPIFQYGVRPPYWKGCNKRLCYVPVEVRK